MNTNRWTARAVGVLFLLAIVTSLVGGTWLESIMTAPDYLNSVSANESQVLIGVLLELINCVAVIGIAVMLFPIIKTLSESLAMGYVGFRFMEAAILVTAVITPLALITLSQEYSAAAPGDASYFRTLGALFIASRSSLTGLLVTVFFSISAILLYVFLYRSRTVPRFIPVWGFIAVPLVFAWNLLEAFGISLSAGIVFGLPIILNEIFLGIWLILKGFNFSEITS